MRNNFLRFYFFGVLTVVVVGALVAGGLYVAEMIEYPRQVPITASTANLTAGARTYVADCSLCHGLAQRPLSNAARSVYPAPPQFLSHTDQLATGLLYFRIHKGLFLTAMPGFGASLSDNQIWQLALLLKNAGNLPPQAQSVLQSAPVSAVPTPGPQS